MAEHIHRFVQSLDVWTHPWYRHWAADDVDEYCEFLRAAGLKARHRGRLPARARGPDGEPPRRPRLGLRRRLGPLPARRGRRLARLSRVGAVEHLALGRPREGLGALLRDARRGGAQRHVRHPRPPRPGQGVGQPRAACPRATCAASTSARWTGSRSRTSRSRCRPPACASPWARSIPRRRSSRCASRPAARWRCRATPTRPTSSATSTSGRWTCCGSWGWSEIAVFDRRERRLEPLG